MSTENRSQKRKAAEMSEEEEETPSDRTSGVLRCGSVEDLKITVGSEKKRIFWYHSVSMASHSRYIDTTLSVPMKERDTKELTFPDISVSEWEAMMNYITNPSASRHMKVKDAMELVSLYDKYDFRSGVELCDDVLSDFIDESPDASDTDKKVEAIVLGLAFNLPDTLDRGKYWIIRCIGDNPALHMQFTVKHIQKLQPMMAGDADISDVLESMHGEKADVENPMFPALFVSQVQLIAARNTVTKLVNVIDVSECEAAGSFDSNGDESIDNSLSFRQRDRVSDRYEIAKQEGENWKIYKRSEALFECKASRYATLPPRNGWKTEVKEPLGFGAYTLKTVEPKLKYFHKSLDGGLREIDTDVLLQDQ